MTARIGTMSVDGTPISQADMARIEAEEQLHVAQQRSAVKVVASAAVDADDCRLLLSVLGLESAAGEARTELVASHAPERPRRRRSAAA